MCFLKQLLVATLFTLGTLSLTHAAKLPYQWHEETGLHEGRIDSVDLRGRMIVVGDAGFTLSPNVRVHGPGQRKASQLSLKPGQHVFFRSTGRGPGYPNKGEVVTDIWLENPGRP